MKSKIDCLSSEILAEPEELALKDGLKEKIAAVETEEWASFIVGGVWLFLDLAAYWSVKKNVGLSRSYGLFLNFWMIIELVSWSVRVGLSLNGYAGLVLLFLGLLVHGLVSIPFENRFEAYPHKGSRFDSVATSFMKTVIILVVLYNVIYHAYGAANITFNTFMR
jgi:hypothetical protein